MEDGDAYVENVQGERVEVDVEDGEFYLRGSGGVLLASAEDGDIIIEEGSFSSATVLLEDGDLELETSLADEGDYRFRCEDGDMDLTFTGGGGEIEAEYDDGDVHASGDLEELEEDEEYVRWRYGKGSARVRLATEDGNIRLRAR
jgi:hypothetical protein